MNHFQLSVQDQQSYQETFCYNKKDFKQMIRKVLVGLETYFETVGKISLDSQFGTRVGKLMWQAIVERCFGN